MFYSISDMMFIIVILVIISFFFDYIESCNLQKKKQMMHVFFKSQISRIQHDSSYQRGHIQWSEKA